MMPMPSWPQRRKADVTQLKGEACWSVSNAASDGSPPDRLRQLLISSRSNPTSALRRPRVEVGQEQLVTNSKGWELLECAPRSSSKAVGRSVHRLQRREEGRSTVYAFEVSRLIERTPI